MAGREYIQAILRAADILELVGNSPNGLSLFQVGRIRKLPKQTAYNILRTLVHLGLLEKEPSHPPRYLLGQLLGSLRLKQEKLNQELVTRAMPVVFRVARETGAEVILSHYTGGEVVGRVRVPAVPDENPIIQYSWRMGPYGTGLVFQAHMSPGQLADYRKRNPLKAYDSSGFWKSYELLNELVARLHGGEYLAYLQSSIFRVIVPILGDGGALAAALTLLRNPVTDISACQASRCIALAVEAAAELSSCLNLVRYLEEGLPGRPGPVPVRRSSSLRPRRLAAVTAQRRASWPPSQ